ncbi:hypothetical protein C6500_07115 [Candidatus Poribacteria bacterium]|nr:MAG: hypothetical protein C6500_07115 [Candidatus Poribacteria bacterium]
MVKIVETSIDAQSNEKLTRPNRLPKLRRAFATIFSEELRVPEIALLSESMFTRDWHLLEEDAARSHLQPE